MKEAIDTTHYHVNCCGQALKRALHHVAPSLVNVTHEESLVQVSVATRVEEEEEQDDEEEFVVAK